MSLSAMSGMSGMSGIINIGDGGAVAYPTLNTTGLIVRFSTNNTSKITLANTDDVTTWAPDQLGSIPTFNLVRSNTQSIHSPQYVSSDATFSPAVPTIQVGASQKAFHANTMNAAFNNTQVTVFLVAYVKNAPRNGTMVRYRNDASPFYRSGIRTTATQKMGWSIFDGGGAATAEESGIYSNNTPYLIVHTHNTDNRQRVRRNGIEIVNTSETAHYNTAGTGRNLYVGGQGMEPVTEACTPMWIADISWYFKMNAEVLANVESSLASYYGITLP